MSSKSCINLGKAPEIFEIAKKFNLNPVLAQAKITTWMKKNNTVEFPTVDQFAKYMGVDLTTVEKTDVSKEVEHFFKNNDNLKGWNELNKEYNAFEREEKAMIISDLFSSFLNESVKQYKTLTRKEVVNELTPAGIFLKVRNLLQYGVENPAIFDWNDSQVEEAKKMLKHFFFFSDLATKYIADRENILITMSDQKVIDINTGDMDVDPNTYESIEDSIEDMYSKEESMPEGWTIKHQHLSAKNSLSNEVRSVLSNVYKIGYNGEIERNSLNFPKKINPDLVHSVLMDKLRYMTESKDLIPMLQELSKQRKWVEPILNLLETDKSLESKFYQDFRKDFVTYRVVKRFIKPDGSFYFKTVDINKPRGIEYLTQEWRDNYESGTQLSNLSIYNTNGTVNRKNLDLLKDKTTKLLSDFQKNSDKYDFNKSSKWVDENIEEVGDILRAIGISETNDVINLALNTNPYGEKSLLKYHHPISKILQDIIALSHTTNVKKIGFLNGSEVPLDWQKEFKNTYVNLATIFSSITEDAIESSVHENGKSYYSHQVPSYLNKYIKKFKYSNEKDFKKFIEQEFGRYHQFYDFKNQSFRDGWIKDLVENSEDRKLLDIHTMLNYNKVDYSSLSELDYTVAMIQEYFSTGNSNSAYYHVPILSDSPAGIFIKFKKYDYGKDSIIPTKDGENQTYEQHLTDKFIEVVKQEYQRIKLVKERNKILSNDGIIKEIKNFDKRGEKFIFFPKLNDHYEEIDRLIQTDSDAAPQMLHKLLGTVINETMAEEFQKAVENWEKIGLFNESKEGTVDTFGTNKENSLSQLHNYFWNSAYATSQIIQMTSGDLSMFGSVEDFQKRNKQIYSPTSKLNSSSKYGKEVLKTVLLKDNIVTSGSLLNYQEVLRSIGMSNSQIGQVLQSYFAGDGGGINQTDGQAYGSLNSFRAIEDMGGRWTEERQKAFDKLIDWSNSKKGIKFTAEDFTKLTGVQPMKPFVYTQKAVKSGIKDDLGNEILIKTPFQNKNSLYMLTITGLMARSPKVVGMNNFMQDNNIDILQFESAVKVGVQGTIDINTINSAKDIKTYLESSTGLSKNAVNEELQSQTVHNIPIEDFGIQQPIDDKLMDKSSLFGSQIRKIITSDMPDDPNFKINVNNKNYTKKEWFDLYNDLIVENIIDDFVRLKDQFGSNEEIEKILLQEIRGNKRYDRDMEAAVTLNKNGEFPIPLYDPIISNQIQQLLTSVIKNRVTKQKIKGGSVVQVSNYGFDENLSVRFKDKDGNIIPTQKEWLSLNKGSDANGYKSYIKDNQNGIAYYEAYMPSYSQLFFDELMDEDTGMINPSNLPEDLRKVIGYRIPTEDKYSMVPIYIKGFLPQQAGSAVMLPADITAIMGSDFDIDKLYIMVPEFTVQQYDIKKIKNKYNELFGASDKILNSIFEDIDDIVGEDQFKEFFNNNKESFLLRTPKFQKVKYNDNKLPQDNSLKARNNMLIDMMWGVLTNKDTAHKMLNPQSFDIQKKIASVISILENNNYEDLKNAFGKDFYNTLNKLSLEELSKISDQYKREFNILNPTTQTFLHKQNMTAAQLIGIAANHNANHSMMQWTKIGLADNIAFTLNGYKLSSLHNILNYAGEYISRNTATYLAASVDAVKDPVLDKLNINTFTADSVFLLSRLGHTPLTIGLFLKQPVIVELTDYYINNKLSGLSKSQIISQFIKNYAQKNGQVLSKIKDTDIRNEELAFNIADKSKSDDFYKGQMKVLNKFIQVFDAATVIGNLTAATRADTGGGASGPTFAATETKMNKLKDFLVSNVYGEKPTIVNGEILSTLIDINTDPNERPTKQGVEELFDSNPKLANDVYEALGFTGDIIQDNKSYYRGQIEEPTIDKNGNLVLYAKEDELYKRAGLKSKGVSMTDNLKSAIDYGNGQLTVAMNLASETYDRDIELERLSTEGYWLIQIPKNISNEIVKESGEVKVIGDKIIIPKGQYKIEQVVEGLEAEITPEQKQQALEQYSQYLDTIFPDSKVKDIVYHGTTKGKFDKFITEGSSDNIGKLGAMAGSIEAANLQKGKQDRPAWVRPEEWVEPELPKGSHLYSLLFSLKNPYIAESLDDAMTLSRNDLKEKGHDGVIIRGFENDRGRLIETGFGDEYIAFEPEQIHILGSKQDIEGFKEFVNSQKVSQPTPVSNNNNYKSKLRNQIKSSELPMLQAFYTLGLQSTETLLGDKFPHFRNDFRFVVDSLRSFTYRGSLSDKTTNKVYDDLLAYIMSGTEFLSAPNLEKYGEEYKYFMEELPKEFAKIQGDQKYKNNTFIQSLKVQPANKLYPFTTIVLRNSGKLSRDQKQHLRDQWADLLYGDKDSKELAMKLFKYNYMRNGFSFSPDSFIHLAPTLLKVNVPQYISQLERISQEPDTSENVTKYSEFIEMFIRNNTNIRELVPLIDKETGINFVQNNQILDSFKVYIPSQNNEEFVQVPPGIQQFKISDNNTSVNFKPFVLVKVGDDEILYKLVSQTDRKGMYEKTKPLGYSGHHKQYFFGVSADTLSDSVEVIKPQFKEFDPSDYTNSSVIPDMDTDQIAMQGFIREYYELIETSSPEELSQARIEYTFTQNGLMDKADTPSTKSNDPLDFDAEAMSKYFNLDDEINTIMNELNAYGRDGNYRRFLKYEDIERVINNFNKKHRSRDKFVASYVKGYHSKDNFVFYRLQIKPRTKLNSIEATQLEYNEKLNKKIREILLRHNIKTGALTTLEAKQALGGVMDTSQAKEAIDGIVELIRLANGERGEQALPEEFAHFVIEAMGNDSLVSRLLNLVNQNNFVEDILGDSFENYKQQYDNNPLMLAKEAAGKLLAKHFLQNQEIQDKPWKSLLKRVINKIKQFFTNILGTDLNKAKYQLESEYNKVAKGIMEGTYDSIISIKNIVNTPDNIKLYNLEERISRDRTLLKKMVETETKLFYIAQSKKTQKQDLIEQKELIEKINRRLERNDKLEELAGIQEFLSHIVSKLTELNTDIQNLYQTKDSVKDINNIAGKLREANDFYHAYMKILKEIKSGMAQDVLDNTSRFGEKIKAQISEAIDHADVIKEAYDTLSIELFSSFLEPFLGEGVRNAYFKRTGENLNISKVLTESDHDIGLASRWLESMSRVNDLPSQLIDSVVKKQKSEARLKTINIAKRLQAAHLKLEKTGIKNTDWMYERDADGKLTGKYVTEVSTNDYYTALHNYKNQLEKDYPGIDNFYTRSVKMNDWFIENREGDTLRPKKSIYASKQYMMLNKAQREYHKEFMNIKEELDKLLPPDVVSLEKTVMMRKDFLERVVKSSNIKEGVEQVVDNLKDLFVRRIDDTDFGDAGIVNTVTDFGGNEVTSLPVYYVKRLENMDALSLDATSTLIAYAHMANDYDSMNNVIHALELGRDVLRERGVSYTQAGNPKVEEIQHMGRKIVNKLFKRGNESNIMQRLNDYFSMQVYGRYIKDQGNVPFTNIKISKLADRINQWTSLASTALSFFVGSTNALTGAAQTNIDAVAGEHFNVKDLANADKNYAKDLKEMIGELGKRVKTSKLSLITELFNTTQEQESKLKYSNMDRKNWLSKMFSMETLYFMSTGGEHWLHTRVALAMMEKIRLKDKNGKEFSLYDSLEVVPIDSKNKSYGAELKVKEGYTKLDGTAFTKNDINTLVNRSAHVNQLLHGVYNRADRDAAQALAQGRLLEMFRKWMYTAITRRYGKGQYNVELDTYSEGYYRTFGNFVLQLVRDLKRGQFMLQSRSKALEPWQKANMLRVITDLGQILTVASLLALVDWDDDDRKNKPWGINAIEYQLRRLQTELLSTAPLPWGVPQEGRRILKSPMAGMTLIQNIIDLTTFWEWSDEVTRGRYKGQSKFVKSVAELVPLNKTIYGIFHPEEKILFYKRDM